MRRNAALLEQVEALNAAQVAWEEERRALRKTSAELTHAILTAEAKAARLASSRAKAEATIEADLNTTEKVRADFMRAETEKVQLQMMNDALARQVLVLNSSMDGLRTRLQGLRAKAAEAKYAESLAEEEADSLKVNLSSIARDLIRMEQTSMHSFTMTLPHRGEQAIGHKWAFATMAFDEPGLLQDHLMQVLPLARALQRLSSFPLLVLTNATSFDDGSYVAGNLARLGVTVLPLREIKRPAGHRAVWSVAHWKLQAWALRDYERIIWLDSDSIVHRSLDWLFERPWMWAQRKDMLCELNVAEVSTGILLLYPDDSDFRGLLSFAASHSSASGPTDVDSLIAAYFQDIRKRPIQLLSDVEAAYGQCLGKASTPYINRDGRPVGGAWNVPNFVHKSGGWGVRTNRYENACFSDKLSLQQYYVGESILNACQWHPLGAYWRNHFCEALAITGVKMDTTSTFCDDACYYRGAGSGCPSPVNATTTYDEYYARTKGMPFLELMK